MEWVPVFLVTFKLIVFGTGMFFAIKWHYDREQEEKAKKENYDRVLNDSLFKYIDRDNTSKIYYHCFICSERLMEIRSIVSKNTSSGIRIGMVLFIVFLVLKLTGTIDWSWWWVTSPLWIPLVLTVAILSVIGIIALILYIIE